MSIFYAKEADKDRRLDSFLAEESGLSRSAVAKLLAEGMAYASGVSLSKNYRLRGDEEITLELPEPKEIEALPEEIPLDILYEDSDLLVIHKKSGMVVHPAPGHESGTLVNALLYHCKGELSGINGALRPGIVHRIDKDTSGLLVVAKNDEAHRVLSRALEAHEIRREYHALVNGGFREDSGTVNAPVGRHPTDRKKQAVLKSGEGNARHAVTHYEVLERFSGITYLKLNLETGRTHQIRVHMAYKGHPLLGDALYGGGNTAFEKKHAALLSGQCLHAKRLSFLHPRTQEPMSFETPLPPEFEKMLSILRQDN